MFPADAERPLSRPARPPRVRNEGRGSAHGPPNGQDLRTGGSGRSAATHEAGRSNHTVSSTGASTEMHVKFCDPAEAVSAEGGAAGLPTLLTGDGAGAIDAARRPASARTIQPRSGNSARALIFHYHLFKNAGSSVDELLRRNFGRRWALREFNVSRSQNLAAVTEFLGNNLDLQAISSHTALLPAPQLSGVEIFPVIFIRHPIDRLRSAYEFERRQEANTPGSRLAKLHGFDGYLRELLQNPRHRQIRNFQTFRLSHNEPAWKKSELERAVLALEKLPFVGLVERFDDSLVQLQIRLRPLFPKFCVQPVHRNASSSRQETLPSRLAKIEEMLGSELYGEILDANANDLAVYELVSTRYQQAEVDTSNNTIRRPTHFSS